MTTETRPNGGETRPSPSLCEIRDQLRSLETEECTAGTRLFICENTSQIVAGLTDDDQVESALWLFLDGVRDKELAAEMSDALEQSQTALLEIARSDRHMAGNLIELIMLDTLAFAESNRQTQPKLSQFANQLFESAVEGRRVPGMLATIQWPEYFNDGESAEYVHSQVQGISRHLPGHIKQLTSMYDQTTAEQQQQYRLGMVALDTYRKQADPATAQNLAPVKDFILAHADDTLSDALNVAFNINISRGLRSYQGLVYLPVIDTLAAYPTHQASVQKHLNNYLYDEQVGSLEKQTVIGYTLASNVEFCNQWAESAIAKQLKEYGIETPVKDIISCWHDGMRTHDGDIGKPLTETQRSTEYAEMVRHHLFRISELEEEQPGSTRLLHEEFGIFQFGHYAVHQLLTQVRQADNTTAPYIIATFPTNDWNGAFSQGNEGPVGNKKQYIHGLAHAVQSDPPLIIRVFEFSKFKRPTALLPKTRRKYGPASGAIMSAHGSPEVIQQHADPTSGRGNRTVDWQISDIMHLSRLENYFKPGAYILFNSCSTGRSQDVFGLSISKAIANAFRTKVIAPDSNTGIDAINISVDQDQVLHLDPIYNSANAVVSLPEES